MYFSIFEKFEYSKPAGHNDFIDSFTVIFSPDKRSHLMVLISHTRASRLLNKLCAITIRNHSNNYIYLLPGDQGVPQKSNKL